MRYGVLVVALAVAIRCLPRVSVQSGSPRQPPEEGTKSAFRNVGGLRPTSPTEPSLSDEVTANDSYFIQLGSPTQDWAVIGTPGCGGMKRELSISERHEFPTESHEAVRQILDDLRANSLVLLETSGDAGLNANRTDLGVVTTMQAEWYRMSTARQLHVLQTINSGRWSDPDQYVTYLARLRRLNADALSSLVEMVGSGAIEQWTNGSIYWCVAVLKLGGNSGEENANSTGEPNR